MLESRTLHPDAESIFNAVLKHASVKFTVERKEAGLGIQLLSMFSGLGHYERLYVHHVTEFRGSGAPFILLLLEKHQMIQKQLSSKMRYWAEVEEVEPVLVFSVAQDMGTVLIQKETLGDRLTDMFLKQDINFPEFPEFSKNYTVMGNNPELVRQFMPLGLLKALSKFKDMSVEINGKLGLVRTEKNLSENVLLQLLNIGNNVSA